MKGKRKNKKTELPSYLEAEFANARPVEEVLAELAESKEDLDKDVEFVTGFTKGQFIIDVYRAMESLKINQSELATRLKKSRQHVSKLLNEDEGGDEKSNFTIKTMAAISCALGFKLGIRLAAPDEMVSVEPLQSRGVTVISYSSFLDVEDQRHITKFEYLAETGTNPSIQESEDVEISAA